MAAALGYIPAHSAQTNNPTMNNQQHTNVMQSEQQTQVTMMQYPQQQQQIMQTTIPYNTVPYYGQQNPGNQQVSAPLIVTPYQYLPAGNNLYPPAGNNLYPPPKLNEWKTIENKKKRTRSPEQSTRIFRQRKMNDYWLNNPVQTENKYQQLAELDDSKPDENNQNVVNVDTKPPPIFIDGVGNIKPLVELLDGVAKDNYTIKCLNSEQVKVQPKIGEKYSDIIKSLQEKKTDFYTYKPKRERSFRVVLKNLHATADIEELKKQLETKGHTVTNVWNIKHRVTRNPLSMFYIDLKPKENNKEIYKIQLLMNSVIKFEAPHTKREIPQCMKCQRFGHTKNFCYKPARCVKCAGDHLTKECTRKEKDDGVKCVNCDGKHPANYRGCLVHKELQQKKYPRKREINVEHTRMIATEQMVQPGMSYAQQASQTSQQQQPVNYVNQPNQVMPIQQSNDMSELKEMMKKLMSQMSTMLNLLSTLVTKMA